MPTIPLHAFTKSPREADKQYKIHRDRLRNMKPSINNNRPKSLNLWHMKRNFKKELKETERIEDIQHANTLLVARMMSISSGDPKYRVPLYIDKTGREGSTTAGKVSFDEGESFFQTILPKTDVAQRRREKKIEAENHLIFKRIVGTKSVYKDQFAETSPPRCVGTLIICCNLKKGCLVYK